MSSLYDGVDFMVNGKLETVYGKVVLCLGINFSCKKIKKAIFMWIYN